MPLSFYFDVHIPIAIARALRSRGVAVLRSQEDHHDETPDDQLLERASSPRRVMVSSDKDMLFWAAKWQAEGKAFF